MQIQDALDRFLVQLQADGRSVHTQKQYARHVRALMAWLAPRCDLSEVGHEDVATFLAAPVARQRADGGLKRATSMNALRTSLRCFLGFCQQTGWVDRNPAAFVRRALVGVPLPRALSDEDVARLESVLRDAPLRDRALFTLCLRSGLRIGSAVGLRVEDVDLDEPTLHLRDAKGGQDLRVPIAASVADVLRQLVANRTSGPLFCIGVRHAARLFARYARTAGIPTTRTHALRHTHAMNLYRRTGDLRLVQQALGHRSIASTTVYARADDRRLREVLEG